VDGARTHTFYKTRDFFGVLRVAEENGRRQLFSGTVLHGSQFLSETLKNTPTTYYGYKSGIGRAIKSEQELRNSVWMAVIGQGAGTLAAYGRHDDQIDFFELDPEVARIANKYFSFIRDAHSGVTTLIGDGRLQMAGTARGPYAVIAVDAFSGDYVPTHLLTREAIGIYKSHLAEDGVLGFHITNKYLDFAPAVVATAQAVGMYVSVVDAPSDPASDIYASRWVLTSKNRMTLDLIGVQISTAVAQPVWTDDYSNIMKLLR
jgi:spermidine synthase